MVPSYLQILTAQIRHHIIGQLDRADQRFTAILQGSR
jgi:hypothetical protein